MRTRPTRLVLVGAGHAHIEVLRRFASQPPPGIELALVSPVAKKVHSAMIPGIIAGHYRSEEAHIDLAHLARRAGARFAGDSAVGLDLPTKTVTLADGDAEPFDLLSLDVGSTPTTAHVRGASDDALAIRPTVKFLEVWEKLQADAASGDVRTIAVVGGGASGVELLLAMQSRFQQQLGGAAPRLALITDQPYVLADHAPAVRARFGQLLVARDVILHLNSGAIAVEPGAVIATHHRRIAVDRVIWATPAGAAHWMAASGLACDPNGFVQTDETLRSTSHPFIFAAGDCASQIAHPRPKSALIAIRHGPVLAVNLLRMLRNEPPRIRLPVRRVLELIGTGGRRAVAARGSLMLEGEWVWRWKERIDRAFVASYAPSHAEPDTGLE